MPSRQLTPPDRWRSGARWLIRLTPLAGPALVAVGVLLIDRRVLFGRTFFAGYKDVLVEWLPNYCFLGKSLSAGHIPAWNPHVFGGMPFAADPLHGWMNLPAMLLFSGFPCTVALRFYIVLQPIVAGLGLLWFLRIEGLSRPAATIGALAISLSVAGSELVGALWFTGALAWTTVLLAAAARYVRAERTSDRLLFLIVASVAWGQIAAAQVTNGLVLGTMVLIVYLVAYFVPQLKRGSISPWRAVRDPGVLLVGFATVNLAFVLPRLGFLGRTTLSRGYGGLESLSLQLSGGAGGAFAVEQLGNYIRIDWPLRLALSPGLHVGAAVLGFSLLAIWTRRHRGLTLSFGSFGLLCYLLSLPATQRSTTSLGTSPLMSFYLHSPFRFGLGLLIVLPVLAAAGLDAWLDRRRSLGPGLTMAGALGAFGLLALLLGASWPALLLFVLGSVSSMGIMMGSLFRPGLALFLPLVLFVELLFNGVSGPHSHPSRLPLLFPRYVKQIDVLDSVHEGTIARTIARLDDGRYLSIDPDWTPQGPQTRTGQKYQPLLARQQSMLFGLEEAQGYNSVQLLRFWQFVRKVDPKAMRYAVSYFLHPPPLALDLLQVRWLIASRGQPPVPGAIPIDEEGMWALYRLPDTPSRASLVTEWTVVRSADAALEAAAAPSFNVSTEAILERDPGIQSGSLALGSGSVSVLRSRAQAIELLVTTPTPAIVLVRNSYDPGWHATVDGRPRPVLPADYVVQGIPVPAGRHTVRVFYDDPAIGLGIIGSTISLGILLLACAVARRRERRIEG